MLFGTIRPPPQLHPFRIGKRISKLRVQAADQISEPNTLSFYQGEGLG